MAGKELGVGQLCVRAVGQARLMRDGDGEVMMEDGSSASRAAMLLTMGTAEGRRLPSVWVDGFELGAGAASQLASPAPGAALYTGPMYPTQGAQCLLEVLRVLSWATRRRWRPRVVSQRRYGGT